jgi:hypothetical protein
MFCEGELGGVDTAFELGIARTQGGSHFFWQIWQIFCEEELGGVDPAFELDIARKQGVGRRSYDYFLK